MVVRPDQAGDERFPLAVNDARTRRHGDVAARRRDAVAAEDHGRALDRRRAGTVDEACTNHGDHRRVDLDERVGGGGTLLLRRTGGARDRDARRRERQ